MAVTQDGIEAKGMDKQRQGEMKQSRGLVGTVPSLNVRRKGACGAAKVVRGLAETRWTKWVGYKIPQRPTE